MHSIVGINVLYYGIWVFKNQWFVLVAMLSRLTAIFEESRSVGLALVRNHITKTTWRMYQYWAPEYCWLTDDYVSAEEEA